MWLVVGITTFLVGICSFCRATVKLKTTIARGYIMFAFDGMSRLYWIYKSQASIMIVCDI